MNKKTAILVFAYSSKEEILHKPIIGGDKLFEELTNKTLAIVKKSKLPYFVFTEKNQIGNTFGERFVHAISTVYDLGFENIITIGNDTPHLKKDHLLESAKQLENNKFVLGPSVDGGFYLMGLHRSQFEVDTFLKLPWQSKNLAKSISFLIKTAKIEVAQLEALQDIDTVYDLKHISRFSFTLSKILQAIIQYILYAYQAILKQPKTFINSYNVSSQYNKGSPAFLA